MLRNNNIRVIATLSVLIVVIAAFVVKLVDIQIIRASELGKESYHMRSKVQVIPGVRGRIVDAGNRELAESVTHYRVFVSPKRTKDYVAEDGQKVALSAAYEKIAGIIGITSAEVAEKIGDAVRTTPDSEYLVIASAVDPEKRQQLEELKVPWLYFEKVYKRLYPFGAVAGNLLGYLNIDQQPQAGLEAGYDGCLAGRDGREEYLSSLDGIPIPGSSRVTEKARNGGKLTLTIDSDLQWYAQQILDQYASAQGADWGMTTVMSAKTGEVLALADYPSADPNNIGAAKPENRGSRAFSAPYEPGSILKPITAAILMDGAGLSPESRFHVPWHFTAPGEVSLFDDVPHPDQSMTLAGILVASSNSGISVASKEMDLGKRYEYLKGFGFGAKTEISFPGQSEGLLGQYEQWDQQTRYASSFGQGISATVLQMASAYQTIANNGVRKSVSMVKQCEHSEDNNVQRSPDRQVVSAGAAQQTTNMLEMVYKHSWMNKSWNIPGYRVAAKTGTAQISNSEGKYSNTYAVSIAGFAPADDPEFVVVTSMYNTAENNPLAVAPVFKKVLSQALKKYRVLPSSSEPKELPLG